MLDRYVAYVGTYTGKGSKGIYIFDVDTIGGRVFQRKNAVEIDNPTYLTVSNNHKYLYSVTDSGVEAFKIQADGSLKFINKQNINGVRPCHISTDCSDKYLFTAGYHDGKVTILRLKSDGAIGEITDEIYHAESQDGSKPHVHASLLTPEEQGLCTIDLGTDELIFYDFDKKSGRVATFDHNIVKTEKGSGPRHIAFEKYGRFAYVIHELKSFITVYEIDYEIRVCRKIQTISTLPDKYEVYNAAAAIKMSPDGKFLFATNRGHNSIAVYQINQNDGTITMLSVLPVSGDEPRDLAIFPNGDYVLSANQGSNTMTLFTFDKETGNLVLNGAPISVPSPTCIVIKEIQ